MKIRPLILVVSALFLVIGIILAIIGFVQKSWLHLLFSLTHSAAGVILWFTYKDMERKIAEANK
jgi:type IV secretory pathway TrbD component